MLLPTQPHPCANMWVRARFHTTLERRGYDLREVGLVLRSLVTGRKRMNTTWQELEEQAQERRECNFIVLPLIGFKNPKPRTRVSSI
jgi:hypothetical protein